MATLSAMAERIAQKKAVHQAKADEWSKRLDAIDKVEPAMFAAGDEVVAAAEEDIAGFEQEMKDIGKNIAPLSGSPAGSNGSLKKE